MNRVLILGAAGKDFHVFNTCYRDDPRTRVAAFTAAQIPNIEDRKYPPALAGSRYPEGIPIKSERFLPSLIKDLKIDEAVFAYSDVPYAFLDALKKKVEAAGAKFSLPDPDRTMIPSSKPVIAICAVRTGSGKSQTTRKAAEILRAKGRRVAVVRHPMPYGDLAAQAVQRFEKIEDLEAHHCTIEEMEEYEPHLRKGFTVFAGVDYARILKEAETAADVILWDGGNNDWPFYKPNLWIVVADPLRAGNEVTHYPGHINFCRAHAIVINKMDSASPAQVETILNNARQYNSNARIVKANSAITCEDESLIRGKRVVVVEDGPTVTHGDMRFGAGTIAAQRLGAKEIIDPRPFAVGSLAETYKTYPATGPVLPAMGYGKKQMKDLEATINRTRCETVVIGTPIDLRRVIKLEMPGVRVTYELEEIGKPDLAELLGPY